ncbi:MAG: hypothetical protein ABJG41_01520 [Cyclobacteriaceae bacterium]
MDEKELEELKERLPRGYFKEVLKRTEVSEKTVANFFSGKRYRQDVHEAALAVAEQHQTALETLRKRQQQVAATKDKNQEQSNA